MKAYNIGHEILSESISDTRYLNFKCRCARISLYLKSYTLLITTGCNTLKAPAKTCLIRVRFVLTGHALTGHV